MIDQIITPEDAIQAHSAVPQNAMPSDISQLYHPVDFCIPVGPIFNFVTGMYF